MLFYPNQRYFMSIVIQDQTRRRKAIVLDHGWTQKAEKCTVELYSDVDMERRTSDTGDCGVAASLLSRN